MYCGDCFAELNTLIQQHKRDYYVDAAGERERNGRLSVWVATANDAAASCDDSGSWRQLDPRVPDELEAIDIAYQQLPDSIHYGRAMRCFACSDVEAIRSIYSDNEVIQHLLKVTGLTIDDVKRDMRILCNARLQRKLNGTLGTTIYVDE
jgi:hypothetical protein